MRVLPIVRIVCETLGRHVGTVQIQCVLRVHGTGVHCGEDLANSARESVVDQALWVPVTPSVLVPVALPCSRNPWTHATEVQPQKKKKEKKERPI